MMLHVLLLTVGFVFLVKGADWFVEGAAGIAKKLGIPQLVIGLTIVAMGTSMPEAAVSITSALSGSAGISIGNVVGSNILNILIILGITAVLTNVRIQKTTFRYEIPFMIGITIILMAFGITGNQITFLEGILFWLLFLIFLGYLFVISKKGSVQDEEEIKELPLWKGVLGIIIGGILVVKGSDFAVEGATEIARYFGMSERFIGLTIVAFGMPNGAPKCEICPARMMCEAYKNGLTEVLPVRAKKKARRMEERTVLLLFQNGKAALRKRADTGLLASLWEFPSVLGNLDEAGVSLVLAQMGLSAQTVEPAGSAKHIFTHIEWDMKGYFAAVTGENNELFWADASAFDDAAIPAAFKKFAALVRARL